VPAVWLIATVPGALVGAALLVVAIRGVVRAMRVETLARLRVVDEQAVAIAKAGPVVLSVQGPHFTTKFGSLSFTVRDADGRGVPTSMIVMRAHKTSLGGTTTLTLRRFAAERPGTHALRVGGIDPSTDYADCAILLTTPTSALLPLWIVGIVASAGLFVGGVVLSIVIAAGPS
jgi:hypothetical protein